MLPPWIKKIGKTKLIFLISLSTAILSVGLSSLIHLILQSPIFPSDIAIAFLIPSLLTPLISIFFFNVLFQLDQAEARLQLLSNTDDLTGAHNRRYFFNCLEQQFALANRYGQPFSMLMIDLDEFKKINDIYGHPAGDEFLCLFAQLCRQESRKVDEFARIGGDEFAFLLPYLTLEKAAEFANRIRLLVEEQQLQYHDLLIQTTISIGVITWTPQIKDSEMLLYLIDDALRNAKSKGKNQTIVVEQDRN